MAPQNESRANRLRRSALAAVLAGAISLVSCTGEPIALEAHGDLRIGPATDRRDVDDAQGGAALGSDDEDPRWPSANPDR